MALGIDKGDVHDGFIKVVVDKATNRLLGAHIVGTTSIDLVPTICTFNE